jgi:hypothetical protein
MGNSCSTQSCCTGQKDGTEIGTGSRVGIISFNHLFLGRGSQENYGSGQTKPSASDQALSMGSRQQNQKNGSKSTKHH